MIDRDEAGRGLAPAQQSALKRKPWRKPEFSVLDVEATGNNPPAGGPDSGSNNMS